MRRIILQIPVSTSILPAPRNPTVILTTSTQSSPIGHAPLTFPFQSSFTPHFERWIAMSAKLRHRVEWGIRLELPSWRVKLVGVGEGENFEYLLSCIF